MANPAYVNATSSTGVCTATAPAAPNVTWNLSSLSVSQAGPTLGPNGKVTIWDGPIGGTAIYVAYLSAPGGSGGTASIGIIQEIPLPRSPGKGTQGIQATPGNAMNIQVTGTGANQVSINARLSDGIPDA